MNPEKTGTKSAAHYQLNVGAGKTATIRLRLSDLAPAAMGDPFKSFAEIMQTRQREADEFYKSITPARVSEDEALRHAPGAGRDAVVQAVFLLRRGHMAHGTW